MRADPATLCHRRTRRRALDAAVTAVLALAAAVVGTTLALAAPATAATGTASAKSARLVVVHGVPGLTADVVLDGRTVLRAFAFERATDPVPLSPGTHRVAVYASGGQRGAALLSGSFSVRAGQHLTAAVGLAADGSPQLATYDDSLAGSVGSPSSVVVRHVAAARQISVRLDSSGPARKVRWGGQELRPVAPGDHTLVVRAGGRTLAEPDLMAAAGRTSVVYVVGGTAAHPLSLVALSMRPTAADVRMVRSGGEPPAAAVADHGPARALGLLSIDQRSLHRLWPGGFAAVALLVLASAAVPVLRRRGRAPRRAVRGAHRAGSAARA